LAKRHGWRLRIGAAGFAGLFLLTGCEEHTDPGPTYSTLGLSGEMLCGFVPRTEVVAALGTGQFTTTGRLTGRGGHSPLRDTGCFVRLDTGDIKAFEVVVWERGLDDGFTEYLMKHPSPGMSVFPADDPHGVVNPAYGAYGPNGKVTHPGAVADAVVGDWYINLRIYRPGKGRDAVADATHLVQEVIASLQLPSQTKTTYTEFTPRAGSTPRPTQTVS
jgi:hypothetical protein